ncbi:flagellar assembly protein FliH [Priestia taiwanensis]|uniref:Flagellar assembly protein FliH n=1 Tax=Priestia taiwanensis TaxID=1347902 RepID=A0A917EQC4_9BACI|nr:flagellar assembly protein FliH [Priestia taiwanensis]MBM7362842.1 flagellar assembly protein FliH [Priestia taiwanensis]GGE65571.1 hypothetical protein GCM10007140_14660 [Priestia taiwanensis]
MSRIIKSYQVLDESNDQYCIQLNNIRLTSGEKHDVDEVEHHEKRILLLEEKERQAIQQKHDFEQYVSEMNMQLAQEREQWLQEKEMLIRQAKDEGYAVGIEEGREYGHSEYHDLLKEAHNIVEQSREEYNRHLDSSDKTILKIGLKVAERILDSMLTDMPEQFMPLVKKAVKEVQEHQDVHIRIHPEKYPLLLSFKEELCELLQRDVDMYIYPDEELQVNDCIIDSSFGRIDASIDTQLAEMKEKLLELMEGERDE